ncbi:Glycoside hydrolase family 2 immunoglobulin-like beta-sandwich [Penicillium cosmopolitanum]|uniref:Beta-mannosidase B n=1 Tax=Penicillium cosmopolitanum TaxID=1131564 RepID=A0A9W9W0Y6_9EURO|nr:Glycoside hydrolase family 2 immunoglobulin-like beta-sandwich [Penicillium cosmopolitanum]KAJ5396567.1 Glycoside hydrolase family 2 immunoglobulin-like beta-sandwich [Penicillium cosmopolitanum]
MGFFELPLSNGWTFKDRDDHDPDAWMSVPAVPSTVQQDLIANKRLEDPYIGFNELKAQWVNEKSWIYRTDLKRPDVPTGAKVVIVFDGLDTFASVTLNGQNILTSSNMFIGHRVDVTKLLLESDGPHVLEIEFDCAQLKAQELRSKYPGHRWEGFNGDMARLAVRKAQYHWGWDWGPVIMAAGIWRDVRLEAYSVRVAGLWPQTQLEHNRKTATITATAEIDAVVSGYYTVSFCLCLRGKQIACQSLLVEVNSSKSIEAKLQINNPELWWPHGYGSQPLYDMSVSISGGPGNELHKMSKRIGIRSAEVIQQPDKHGKSFFFRINGQDIFCGGSCWIPADSLLPSIRQDRYKSWIDLMVKGGQTMVRVWGGGIYEDKAFYETCDEMGLLVWQDFMFACGNYPVWPELLESIQREVTYNICRLRHHPSIVIYVGNNEDYQVQEQAYMTYNYEDKDPQSWLKTNFPARYIYEKLLPDAVAELSPSTFYHPGSPWGDGKLTSDPTVGDMHQWNADGHERRLATYLVENLRTATDLETYIHLTQVVQAETMMFGYRGWRRQWGNDRQCGGALLWQINDCWPTISWAIVDYFQRPKPAYYTVKRVMESLAVGVRREHHDWSVVHARPPTKSKYEIWVASSRREGINATVELRFLSVMNGDNLRPPIVYDVTVTPNGTTDIVSDGVIDHIAQHQPHVLAVRLWVNGRVVSRDADWPQPLKYLDFSDRGLVVKVQNGNIPGQQRLAISVLRPVKCLVFEERDNIKLSDSALDIMPGDEQVVTVSGLSGSDLPLKYRFLGQ